MTPMLIPQVIGIDTGNDQARNRHAVVVSPLPLVPPPETPSMRPLLD